VHKLSRLIDFFHSNSVVHRLQRIKDGDEVERERVIEEYIPFIIKSVSSCINHYIETENSEEYSVGIQAFNEAIDKYDRSKGKFISFARLVIQSRMTDYIRKTANKVETVPLQDIETRGKDCFTEQLLFKEEIKEFEMKLKDFNITLEDLVTESPKHVDTRANAVKIAKHIVNHPEIKTELFRKKTLPVTQLIRTIDVTEKILKRSRKFIIATVLILDSDSEKLKTYVKAL
jgi:RNA polymerase sigma factor